jgi:hypothetical protein
MDPDYTTRNTSRTAAGGPMISLPAQPNIEPTDTLLVEDVMA